MQQQSRVACYGMLCQRAMPWRCLLNPTSQPQAQQLAAALVATGVQLDLHPQYIFKDAVQSAFSTWQLKKLQDAATREGASKLQRYTQVRRYVGCCNFGHTRSLPDGCASGRAGGADTAANVLSTEETRARATLHQNSGCAA
jgi:hypothetical protein